MGAVSATLPAEGPFSVSKPRTAARLSYTGKACHHGAARRLGAEWLWVVKKSCIRHET
jgi:hypothetical protein